MFLMSEIWREGNVVEILGIAILVRGTEARLIDGGNVRHDFDRPEVMTLLHRSAACTFVLDLDTYQETCRKLACSQ